MVHLVGGTAGLIATIVMGPRRGRFGPNGEPRVLKGHSDTLVAQGIYIYIYTFIHKHILHHMLSTLIALT